MMIESSNLFHKESMAEKFFAFKPEENKIKSKLGMETYFGQNLGVVPHFFLDDSIQSSFFLKFDFKDFDESTTKLDLFEGINFIFNAVFVFIFSAFKQEIA